MSALRKSASRARLRRWHQWAGELPLERVLAGLRAIWTERTGSSRVQIADDPPDGDGKRYGVRGERSG